MNVSQVITKYRRAQGKKGEPMSLREMAQSITDAVQTDGHSVSHQSVLNWESEVHVPHAEMLISLANRTPVGDWRREMAFELLAALNAMPINWGLG